jgi:hypothetical protein
VASSANWDVSQSSSGMSVSKPSCGPQPLNASLTAIESSLHHRPGLVVLEKWQKIDESEALRIRGFSGRDQTPRISVVVSRKGPRFARVVSSMLHRLIVSAGLSISSSPGQLVRKITPVAKGLTVVLSSNKDQFF